MATEQKTVTVEVPPSMSQAQFLEMMKAFASQISTGIATGINEARPQKITAGRYDPRTPFQPDKTKSKRLIRPVYQNATRLNPMQLFNAEITLLNQINRSGRYLDRKVEVILREEGSEEYLEIRYKNRTIDDRMEIKSLFRSFQELLEKIVAEQNVINEEEGRVKLERKAFSTAATREARERLALKTASEQPDEP